MIYYTNLVEETRLKWSALKHTDYNRTISAVFYRSIFSFRGKVYPKEEGRYEIKNVPVKVRERDRLTGKGAPLGVKNMNVFVLMVAAGINQQPAGGICMSRTSSIRSSN